MRILENLIPTTEDTAVALGYFDGVHHGHRKVIELAVECKKEGLTPVVFTFSHTPKKGDDMQQLLTLEQRAEKLKELGIEILYIIDFQLVKNYSPEDFIEKIVKNIFNAKKVFCGFNYHFGKNGAGDCHDLKRLCSEFNIETQVADPVIVDGETISSSRIRNLLRKGEIEKANELMGYDFGYHSQAVRGKRIGSQIGTPTINQNIEKEIILPEFGVYASVVTFDGKSYAGVTNVGVKPTVTGRNIPLCETWLPEYKGGDLYGKIVDVRLKHFIRKERKFNGLEELKSAIEKDGQTALKLIK